MTTTPFLPLCDLRPSLARDESELRAAFDRALATGEFVLGEAVSTFENELASYVGTRHAVGVASGSDALELTLRALDIGRGDAVVTTPFSFVATAESIAQTGATVAFVDVREHDWLLDLDLVNERLAALPAGNDGRPRLPSGECVRAVLPVHLFGAVLPRHRLSAIAERFSVDVIEDAAQALGGASDGRRAGSLGRAGCLSFFPSKTLGALGDGGAVVTDDDVLAARLRSLRQHGRTSPSRFDEVGRNSRLDALQAAFLSVRLRRLDADGDARRAAIAHYARALAPLAPAITPLGDGAPDAGHAGQQMVVRARDRDAAVRRLHDHAIGYGIYYPAALHEQPAYRAAVRLGPLDNAVAAARVSLALPLFSGISPADVDRVVAALAAGENPLSGLAPGGLGSHGACQAPTWSDGFCFVAVIPASFKALATKTMRRP